MNKPSGKLAFAYATIASLEEKIARLEATQPAPVAVVMPDRKDPGEYRDASYTQTCMSGEWNACLDEVTRLTATVRIPERLIMTDGLHTYEYVTGHNDCIDKALGVKS